MAGMIGRILLTLVTLAVTGFVLLVLIGLWDRYERETVALGFSGIYERYLASQGGYSGQSRTQAAAEAKHARGALGREHVAQPQSFQQPPEPTRSPAPSNPALNLEE
jgi:hypothetical protein